MTKETKATSASAFLADMFESEVDKKELQDRLVERRVVSKLAAIRAAKNVTQKDMAHAMGCTQGRISKLESGVDADLRISDIVAYAKRLDVDFTLMFSDRGKSLAQQIKSHAFSIRSAFLKLVELAHKDNLIAKGVAQLHFEAFQNLNRFLSETAEKLPVSVEDGKPYLQISEDEDGICVECQNEICSSEVSGCGAEGHQDYSIV